MAHLRAFPGCGGDPLGGDLLSREDVCADALVRSFSSETPSESIGVFRLHEVAEVSSTNDVVKAAIDAGYPEGFAVRSDVQSGGYGRYGRHWESPAGGLYMSVLLRPADHIGRDRAFAAKLPTLSLVTGLAVRCALSKLGAPGIYVKWPNDVVVNRSERLRLSSPRQCEGCSDLSLSRSEKLYLSSTGITRRYGISKNVTRRPGISTDVTRHCGPSGTTDACENQRPMFHKICGISLEAHHGAICVGMGVNVFRPKEKTSLEMSPIADVSPRNCPAYLEDLPGVDAVGTIDLSKASRSLLTSLDDYYRRWIASPFEDFVGEYNEFCLLSGCNVRIERNDGAIEAEGEVLGINGYGQLEVLSQSGEVVAVSSGEAHVVLS